jgi:hypothetical protein
MEYKAFQFEIIQMTNPGCWKWVVFLDATKTRTGIALTRADAVLDAEFARESVGEPTTLPQAIAASAAWQAE